MYQRKVSEGGEGGPVLRESAGCVRATSRYPLRSPVQESLSLSAPVSSEGRRALKTQASIAFQGESGFMHSAIEGVKIWPRAGSSGQSEKITPESQACREAATDQVGATSRLMKQRKEKCSEAHQGRRTAN